MDGAHKSKRLFPGHTLKELQAAFNRNDHAPEHRAKLALAIAQRDPNNPAYVPHFKVPQL